MLDTRVTNIRTNRPKSGFAGSLPHDRSIISSCKRANQILSPALFSILLRKIRAGPSLTASGLRIEGFGLSRVRGECRIQRVTNIRTNRLLKNSSVSSGKRVSPILRCVCNKRFTSLFQHPAKGKYTSGQVEVSGREGPKLRIQLPGSGKRPSK